MSLIPNDMASATRATTSLPRLSQLCVTPDEMARGLAHLPGLVFFDSVGNLPANHAPPLSIIGARPVEVIKGDISDPVSLEKALTKWRCEGRDYGFPTGAACGWVDYDGQYCFGIYPELLAYHHATGEWWEIGSLSEEFHESAEEETFSTGEWRASMEKEDFIRAVGLVKEYIAAGDIYQVNLSRRIEAKCDAPNGLLGLYEKLRVSSPAPLASYFNLEGREVLSSSPETFLRFSGNEIETRPIKGTRPRFADPELDSRSAFDLRQSEKETAELVMITDLLRNDLGQVCEFGSVQVTDMLQLEKLQHVHHLVSTIKGTLRDDISHLDALAACFPGGSITGAPKKRAREIISELEPCPRGLYTGAMGYFGFNGESQFNIPIRTLIHEHGTLAYHVGAGIVADSEAEAEFEETEHKAAGVRLALSKSRNS
ncbi:anthranilate synthase component I family protein [Akkermansiaceae bacterium]|nr:anthranilate synthase component I family protein [Akkermansiaceae bacterium]